MGMKSETGVVSAAKANSSRQIFYPAATIRCDGSRLFRSQTARDVACLLDVDPSVTRWLCMPTAFDIDGYRHVPDFETIDQREQGTYLDAPDRRGLVPAAVIEDVVARTGRSYAVMSEAELRSGFRLRNAKDLLRYGNYTVTLGDRIRLLAALDEHGTLTFAECLGAFQETKPVAGLCSLILHEMISIDLDSALIGPATVVRRIGN